MTWRGVACVPWWGYVERKGYGRVHRTSGKVLAHRMVWEACMGPIPEGMELDHLCRNRACVNPAHLEVVTTRENILRGEGPGGRNARKTDCDYGHGPLAWDEPQQQRLCPTCKRTHGRERTRRYRARLRERVA